MKPLITILAVSLTACASIGEPGKNRVTYESNFAGNHAVLAYCVTEKLQKDGRWSMRLLQFRNRTFQDTDASEILAHDMRLLPGVYARNSPTNPDAVMEYVSPAPEVVHTYDRIDQAYLMPAFRFSLMLKATDGATVSASLKGNLHLGRMAWQYLQTCARPE
ncbi:hypothetical protein [Nitrosomonas halophila]|jgi:hypothetical protein|uniref:Uncharacterized protein n=1 Tax=Nitrosomonas halophila TaxID=44576 RepID=A0A1H3HK76_9PROT|nr:hypothetical protein [Nitrosomonas halophila]SDY15069.1 hypothetical protein SAMN05421881_102013 [Nitrosomonas halophila]